jgi:hypothetical protein
MKPGGILVLNKEVEGATEEDPCCVSALLGWFSNEPVAVGSTLHAIASTASSRSVLTFTLLRACFGTGEAERESLLPICPCLGASFKFSLLFVRDINLTKCLFCSCGEALLLGSAAEDKSKREEESSSLLEGGFLPARPVEAREGGREKSKLELLEVVILLLGASSAAVEEEEEEESELADLPCLDKGLGVFFFFFSFLSLLALELLGILI